VYATIVNCLRNQGEIDGYLARIEEIARRDMAESDAHLSPARQRLLKWRQQQQVADPRNQGFWKMSCPPMRRQMMCGSPDIVSGP
jgi:hypothetical protein